MNCSTSLSRRIAFAGLALGLGTASLAFNFILNEDSQLPVKWPAGTIKMRIMLGETKNLSDGNSFNSSAQSAAQTWNSVIGAAQFETELLPAGQAVEQSGAVPAQAPKNEMVFSADVFGRSFGDALAVTTVWAGGNERGESDILFNSAYQWDSYTGAVRFTTGNKLLMDLRRVALHELGHSLGLGHSTTGVAIMNPAASDLYVLTNDDIDGARCLYGPPGAPANDNFANAFPISMEGRQTVSTSHYNTKATKEAGDPRQGDNPGGRSVWWRWTAPSAGNVTLDTKGSYFDTTLGVYTGSALAGLVKIADNDDIDPGVRQNSSLTFKATAGTEYRIDVDGYNAIELLPTDTAGADNGGVTLNLAFDGSLGTAPTITSQPVDTTISGASATLSVTASGSTPLTYQWFFNDNPITGSVSSTLAAPLPGTYYVTISNAAGVVKSNLVTLTALTPTPPPAPSGGGGGGGAPSLWFCAALAGLTLARSFARR